MYRHVHVATVCLLASTSVHVTSPPLPPPGEQSDTADSAVQSTFLQSVGLAAIKGKSSEGTYWFYYVSVLSRSEDIVNKLQKSRLRNVMTVCADTITLTKDEFQKLAQEHVEKMWREKAAKAAKEASEKLKANEFYDDGVYFC